MNNDPTFTRRQLLPTALLGAATWALAIQIGKESRREKSPIRYIVKQGDPSRGILDIIQETFPELSEQEVLGYFGNGNVKNITAEANKRNDPYDIQVGDILELQDPFWD